MNYWAELTQISWLALKPLYQARESADFEVKEARLGLWYTL